VGKPKWFPNLDFDWPDAGSWGSLGTAQASAGSSSRLFDDFSSTPSDGPRHEHDFITERDPFATDVDLVPDHLTEITTAYTPTLDASSNTKYAGIEIPGITNGYAGSAPDVGALIEGRPIPSWGAPP
jgi:hypothetical protein